MINRKLLKANRWFDEEFLEARMTNACFNGGGGGDGGGADDDEAYEGEAMREYEREYGGRDDDIGSAANLAAAQAAQEAAAAQAAQQAAIDAQMAQEQAARQAQAQAAAAAAQARQRANEFASAQAAQQEAEARQRANEFASAQAAQQEAAAREAAQRSAAAVMDEQARMGAGSYSAPDTSQYGGQAGWDQAVGSAVGRQVAAERQAARNLANMQGYDPQVVTDTTRSPSGFTGGGMMDYTDMTGGVSGTYGTGSTAMDASDVNYSGDMNLAMAHAYDQRFSGNQNHPWNQLSEQEKRNVVTREQQGPSKIANFFNLGLDSRLTNLANSELGNRTPGPGSPGWDRHDTVSYTHLTLPTNREV